SNSDENDGHDNTRKIEPKHPIMAELADMLISMKDKPGTFATDGVLQNSPFPGLNIKGVGPICLPLCDTQAKKIISVANQAPFGLGEKTLVDETVRKSWAIQPDKILLENPIFQSKLQSVVSKVKEDLGCDSNHVKAEIYKLLLYEEDGHFKPHRDSEKEDGMFATLIVQLPSIFTGNDLIVNHNGKTKVVKFDRQESRYEIIYAAHYADCEHEITPLKCGYRIALVYNLIWTFPNKPPPSMQSNETIAKKLTMLLKKVGDTHENVFGWPLEHRYSKASLTNGLAALKGKDRYIGLSFNLANKALSEEEKFSFYISKLSRETVEGGDHDWQGCFEGTGDLDEDDTSIEKAYGFDGQQIEFKSVKFDVESDLLGFEKQFDGDVESFWGDHDKEEVDGPTGNEGSSCNRWYSTYIILAVPEKLKFALVCNSGFKQALRQIMQEFEQKLPKLKGHMVTFLEKFSASSFTDKDDPYQRYNSHGRMQQKGEKNIVKVVKILTKLADPKLTSLFISKVLGSPRSSWGCRNDSEIYGLIPELPIQSFATLLLSVPWQGIEKAVIELISRCPTAQLSKWLDVFAQTDLTEIADKVIDASFGNVVLLTSREHFPLFQKAFQLILNNEKLHSSCWEKVTKSVSLINSIELLAYLCSSFPPKSFIFDFLFNSIIGYVKNATDLIDTDRYSTILLEAVKPILNDTSFKDKLSLLCSQITAKQCFPIIGKILSHVELFTNKETFNLFLLTFMKQFSSISLEASHIPDIVNIAKVLYSQNTSSDMEQRKLFIATCQKINNPDILCVVITELSTVFHKAEFSFTLSHLIKSLLILLQTQPFGNTDAMVALLLLMFNKEEEKMLEEFVSNKFIVNSAEILGKVLLTLCSDQNKENYGLLKINKSFQNVLRYYINHCTIMKPDSQCFSTVLIFLFKNEKWSLASELLPTLLEIDFIKEDFKSCFESVIKIKSKNTSNYIKLLNVCIDSLDYFLGARKSVSSNNYKLILEFTKKLAKSGNKELSEKLSNLNQLKCNDIDNMFSNTPSILKQLLDDLKTKHENTITYQLLTSTRARHLQNVQAAGPPLLDWSQPNAVIQGQPDVQHFLRSNQETFIYKIFKSVFDARNWVSRYSGKKPSDGYNFQTEIKGTGKNTKVILQKNREDYDFKLRMYSALMAELKVLNVKLQALSNKRPSAEQSNLSGVSQKVQVIQID
uniref:Fe2OG dioxygenase domain-containing protein n=2 Tax=Clytia hemisphaerica TaxID=252671 RepID=A0A7M5WST4_9CNID